MGFAIFQVGFEGTKSIPKVLEFLSPVLKLDDVIRTIIDIRTDDLPKFTLLCGNRC